MYIDPNHDAMAAFFADPPDGPVVMLNLLRFREVADYSAHPDLAPDGPISGAEAYARYAEHAAPFVAEAGGEVVFYADGGAFLIGPPDHGWDAVLLIRQKSAQTFLSFASNEAYLAGIGHRTAALADSRLMPMVEKAFSSQLSASSKAERSGSDS